MEASDIEDFEMEFNNVLIEAYHNVLTLEEATRKHGRLNISLRDRNLLSFLRKNAEGKSLSEIAKYLKITKPSATTTVKKLAAAGLVTRRGSSEDERSTIVTLTRKGKLMNDFHWSYRTALASKVGADFTNEEREVLFKGLTKLNETFEELIERMDSHNPRKENSK